MRTRFHDRSEGGRLLAENLGNYAKRPGALVLALPRGGVPVAAVVARRLRAPLDVFVVRKLGLPGHAELAMGALAAGGVRVVNNDVVDSLRIPQSVFNSVAAEEQQELERRERLYRGELPPPNINGKTIILIDDGIATGSTMMAAVAALRQLNADRIVVAAPVIAGSTYYQMRSVADDVAAVIVPEKFLGVGQWYEDFSQTTDDEVRELLAQAGTLHHASS